MIGQGLNSLIPPRDDSRRSSQQPTSVDASANNAQTHQPAPTSPSHAYEFRAAHPPIAQAGDIPVQPVPDAIQYPQVVGIEVTPQEREEFMEQQRRESIAIDLTYTPEHPNVIQLDVPQHEHTAEVSEHVAYHPLGYHEHEPIKRAAGFSKRTAMGDAIFHIEIDKIKPNPFQPRKHFDEDALRDLANSIREFGILQPLVVSKVETPTENGTRVEYQLIAGERRLRASQRAGLERVPVIIRQAAERAEQLELAIIENLQRENLDTIETARSYARLQDEFGLTQREIASRLGKSREVIGNALRLLALPVEIQDALSHEQINESQARLLLSIPNMTVQKQLFADLLTKNFSVRELKAKIKNIHNPPEMRMRPAAASILHTDDAEVYALQNQLKEVLGTEVRINKHGDSGKIIISFYSPEELYGVVKRINPGGE